MITIIDWILVLFTAIQNHDLFGSNGFRMLNSMNGKFLVLAARL